MLFPRYRMIGADDHLTGADLCDQVTQCLRSKNEGVEIELVQILGRLFLQYNIRVAILRRHKATVVRARRIGWQIAATMCSAYLKPRVLVECALEDQVLQGNRRIERIADRVRQPAVAFESFCELGRTLRMNEQNRPQFRRLRPYRMKLRVG